ncbi:MAG: hypothetical protein D6790_17195, partial [Caldilineae bacterium]
MLLCSGSLALALFLAMQQASPAQATVYTDAILPSWIALSGPKANRIDAEVTALKIAVRETGLHRLGYDDLA